MMKILFADECKHFTDHIRSSVLSRSERGQFTLAHSYEEANALVKSPESFDLIIVGTFPDDPGGKISAGLAKSIRAKGYMRPMIGVADAISVQKTMEIAGCTSRADLGNLVSTIMKHLV